MVEKSCNTLTRGLKRTRLRVRFSVAVDVTALLMAWGQGDQSAFNELVSLVHQELHRLAHLNMARERTGHSLQSTALINEAFLKLVDCGRVRWQDRAHFFAVSANLMRRILVDYARRRKYHKRGSGVRPVALVDDLDCSPQRGADLVALDDSLAALASIDPRKSKVVELKFFGGLTTEEIAEVLDVSPPTVLRDWKLAKSWLQREMKGKCP
jgi:RNA polymerase sigma-70 factor, ECF subfamily